MTHVAVSCCFLTKLNLLSLQLTTAVVVCCEVVGGFASRGCAIAGMSAVLPHLVAQVDASFRKGDEKGAKAAQATLNKW